MGDRVGLVSSDDTDVACAITLRDNGGAGVGSGVVVGEVGAGDGGGGHARATGIVPPPPTVGGGGNPLPLMRARLVNRRGHLRGDDVD